MSNKVLVTGGAGYIGSHTCLELIDAGFEPIIFDNFCNSKPVVLARLAALAGRDISCITGDVTSIDDLDKIFSEHDFCAVLHFAGLKAVGESNDIPLSYYRTNVYGSLLLAQTMAQHGVRKLIFSSSATVYGDPVSVPIDEQFATSATNPYGQSKLMVEHMLRDWTASTQSDAQVCLLRYFNPIGAHESGTIGEDPQGIPNNLLPYVAQVAVGKLECLQVFGDDYPTIDGTGVRDYIHVVDLAKGHVKALQALLKAEQSACWTYNLGTGQGYSVLEVVRAFEAAAGVDVPYQVVARRPGDIAECYANPTLAAQELGWRAEFDLKRMVADAWRWQSQNPNGFDG